MEVTSDLSRGVRPVLQLHDCWAFQQSASFFLISSCRVLFPKWPNKLVLLIRGCSGVFSQLWCFFFLFFPLALGSKCQPCAVEASHPASPNTCRCCWSHMSDGRWVVCDVLVAECEEPSQASVQHKTSLTRKSTFNQPLNPCTLGESSAFNFTQFCN